MRYTEDPAFLILPTGATIGHIAKREGLGQLTGMEEDFIWDLLAKAGGAKVAEFDPCALEMEAATHAILEAEAYQKRHGDDVFNAEELTWRLEQGYTELQCQMHAMLEEWDLNQIPGYNHATKAVLLVKYFRQAMVRWLLYVLELAGLAMAIQAAIDKINGLSPRQLARLQEFVTDVDNPQEAAKDLGIELEVSGLDVSEMLRVAQSLEEFGDFHSLQNPPVPDPNGEDVRGRGIRDLSELGRVNQQAYTLPRSLRTMKALTGQLDVREAITRHNQKQLLFVVADGTSSMLGSKAVAASRAAGILMSCLRAVIKGEVELYLRFFDKDLRKGEYCAGDPATARELLTSVVDPCHFLGVDTKFDPTLRTASDRARKIMAERKLLEPQMILVTDGQADVPGISVLDGAKLHVLQVGQEEVWQLARLAKSSGGMSVYFGARGVKKR